MAQDCAARRSSAAGQRPCRVRILPSADSIRQAGPSPLIIVGIPRPSPKEELAVAAPTTLTATETRIELTVLDGAARITLDGPRTRNALDETSAAALAAACERIDADPSIGVAVITGAHGSFCSGAVRGFLAGL